MTIEEMKHYIRIVYYMSTVKCLLGIWHCTDYFLRNVYSAWEDKTNIKHLRSLEHKGTADSHTHRYSERQYKVTDNYLQKKSA